MRDVRKTGRRHELLGGTGKRVDGISLEATSELSVSTPTNGRLQPRTRWNGAKWRNKGRNVAKWIVAEKVRAGVRHRVVCPKVTGRIKDRIAQTKRARAGLLVIIGSPQVTRT